MLDLFYSTCVIVLPALYMCPIRVPGAGSQKRASDALELVPPCGDKCSKSLNCLGSLIQDAGTQNLGTGYFRLLEFLFKFCRKSFIVCFLKPWSSARPADVQAPLSSVALTVRVSLEEASLFYLPLCCLLPHLALNLQ